MLVAPSMTTCATCLIWRFLHACRSCLPCSCALRCAPSLHARVPKYKSTEVQKSHPLASKSTSQRACRGRNAEFDVCAAHGRCSGAGHCGGLLGATDHPLGLALASGCLKQIFVRPCSPCFPPPCPLQPPILFACNSASHPAPRSEPKRIRRKSGSPYRDILFPSWGGFAGDAFATQANGAGGGTASAVGRRPWGQEK